MGVSYREELQKNRKKRSGRPESATRPPGTEASERAAIRKEYFRVARAGYRKMAARAAKRVLDAR